MFKILKHQVGSMFNRINPPTPTSKRDEIYKALTKSINHPSIKILVVNGPNFYTVKIHNYANLRTYRFEIDAHGDGPIAVYQLERTHNIVHDINEFYIGTRSEVRYDDLLWLCKSGKYLDEWLTATVDRSCDIEVAAAYRAKDITHLPENDEYVNYAIVDKVKLLPAIGDRQKIVLTFVDLPGEITVIVPRRNVGLYQPDRLYITNTYGKHAVFKLTKARKFLKFKAGDWKELQNINDL